MSGIKSGFIPADDYPKKSNITSKFKRYAQFVMVVDEICHMPIIMSSFRECRKTAIRKKIKVVCSNVKDAAAVVKFHSLNQSL